MSLDYNVSKVSEAVRTANPVVTESLIWATMAIGMHEITEANAKEFYQRINLQEKVLGTYRTREGKPVYMSLEDVTNHIGLQTNARNDTRLQFLKRVARIHFGK